MQDTYKIHLVVSGDNWSPTALSAALNIQPTRVKIKGESQGAKRPPAPSTEWVYEMEHPNEDVIDVNLTISKLLHIFVGREDMLCDFVKKNGLTVTINCLLDNHTGQLPIWISEKNIRSIASLEANLGMDILVG